MRSFDFRKINYYFYFFFQANFEICLFLQFHAEYFIGVAWVSANGDVSPSASEQNEFSVF